MNKLIIYYRGLGFKDFFTLLFGSFLYALQKHIPKKIFQDKNAFDYVLDKKGIVKISKDVVHLEFDQVKYDLRKKGSDIKVFLQIVVEDELRRLLELMSLLGKEEIYVLDCGANIGLTTIMMKKHFPHAKIISLEPEADNYQQLVKNIALNGYSDIVPLRMGVWYETNKLSPVTNFRDGENWAFALDDSGDEAGSISVSAPNEIVNRYGWDRIDVLKIDIEGAEFPLLRNMALWEQILDTVQIISLEVHEDVGSLFEIVEVLLKKKFVLERSGELLIGVRR